ncbi:MAG: hypothetical protein LBH00_02610 [Planctomycetaceae bacterium]|jgi:hypothetical protein|nr:hypothetical protein [Planctomycetaceae bacterium]
MLKNIPRIYWILAVLGIMAGLFIFAVIRKHENFYTNSQDQEEAGKQQAEKESGTNKRTFGKPQFNVSFKRFANAETLRRTRSKELLAEAEEVLKQKGLPADVFTDDVSQSTNIARVLHEHFHQYYDIIDGKSPNDPSVPPNDMRKLWNASPVGAWDIDQAKIGSVKEILGIMQEKRLAVRSMLEQRETCFYYQFSRPKESWQISIDIDASKYLADYALLEEYAVADALLKGKMEDVYAAAAYTFRIAQLASVLPAAGVRADAALVRLRLFDVMQRILLDPKLEPKHLLWFSEMLKEQYAGFTPESNVWFGDRAAGIKLYNDILIQGPDSALDILDIQKMEERKVYLPFVKGFLKSHITDEVFYLRSMQRIIDASKKPYHTRKPVLDSIRRALQEKYDTPDEPYVAQLQLKDVDRLMRLYAQDESALRRALVLMLVSLGQAYLNEAGEPRLTGTPKETGQQFLRQELLTDPFTGKPYKVKRVDGLLTIASENLPRTFRIPDFRKKEQP